MNALITTLKSKVQTILCIILATLLTVSYLSGKADRTELRQVSDKLTEHVLLNERLSKQNLELAQELKDKPAEYITIVKEVDRQVCTGLVKQQIINSLPKKEVANVANEKNIADIDDRLPDNIIQLLK